MELIRVVNEVYYLFDDWLNALFHGIIEIEIPTFVLTHNSDKYCGSGRLTWQEKSRIRVKAETNGVESLIHKFGSRCRLEQLVPDDLSACGETHDGWNVSISPVPLNGYSISLSSPRVLWDFTTHGMVLTRKRKSGRDGQRVIRALMGPSPKTWIRSLCE